MCSASQYIYNYTEAENFNWNEKDETVVCRNKKTIFRFRSSRFLETTSYLPYIHSEENFNLLVAEKLYNSGGYVSRKADASTLFIIEKLKR